MIGYEGLYIVDTTAFLRPVQIVRQFISNHGHSQTCIAGISPYHRYKGLSSLPKKAGNRKDTNIPIGITNPISLMRVYVDIKVWKVWDKRFDK